MVNVKWLMGFEDLTEVHKIRQHVFINEQKVPFEIEFDGTDSDAIHLLLLDDQKPFGTGRIILIDDEITLDRLAILPEYRNKGYGKELVTHLVKRAYLIGGQKQHVHAQVNLIPFFEKLGFVQYGNQYKEAGYIHVSMLRQGKI